MIIERLKQLRIRCGFSQPDFASILNIPLSTYRSYEQGKREPNNDLLIEISKKLNTTTDYLLGREESVDDTSKSSNLLNCKNLSTEEIKLLKNFIQLSKEERIATVRVLEKLIKN